MMLHAFDPLKWHCFVLFFISCFVLEKTIEKAIHFLKEEGQEHNPSEG